MATGILQEENCVYRCTVQPFSNEHLIKLKDLLNLNFLDENRFKFATSDSTYVEGELRYDDFFDDFLLLSDIISETIPDLIIIAIKRGVDIQDTCFFCKNGVGYQEKISLPNFDVTKLPLIV